MKAGKQKSGHRRTEVKKGEWKLQHTTWLYISQIGDEWKALRREGKNHVGAQTLAEKVRPDQISDVDSVSIYSLICSDCELQPESFIQVLIHNQNL